MERIRSYRFLSSSCGLEFLSLEVKYDIFRYGLYNLYSYKKNEFKKHV